MRLWLRSALVITCLLSTQSLFAQQSTSGPLSGQQTEMGITDLLTTQTTIAGVPSYGWFRGCGPTALGMVVGFWDGARFSDLIPGNAVSQTPDVDSTIASTSHYVDYSLPIDYSPNLLSDKSTLGGAHSSNCIADFMNTSWSSRSNFWGWSWFTDVGTAFTQFVSFRNSQYLATRVNAYYSGTLWNTYKSEIDQGRPVVLLVDSDGNGSTDHFVTGIGYDESNGTYGVYNTWDNAVHWYTWRAMSSSYPWGVYGITMLRLLFPLPATTALSRTEATAGGPAITISVYGTHFVPASLVMFNGSERTTTYQNPGEVQVLLSASDLTLAGSYPITVVNPTPGGGTSNAQMFTVVSNNTAHRNIPKGWNLVSVPLTMTNYNVSSLFPGSISDGFTFEEGYKNYSVLENGVGYWLNFGGDTTVNHTGLVCTADTVTLTPGWNMIGSISCAVSTGSIGQIPPGVVDSRYFGYGPGGYEMTTSIAPMAGYWVKANQAGQLVLRSGASKPGDDGSPGSLLPTNLDQIVIVDAAGSTRRLYYGQNSGIDPKEFALPPIPPEGMFDVRFETQSMVETRAVDVGIEIRGGRFPITIRCGRNPTTVASLVINGRIVTLQEDEAVARLEQPAVVRFHMSASGVPQEFGLSQNYPNPFNPNTIIRYQLPMDNSVGSRHAVTLRVYDLLGREVATLVNETKEPGSYDVTFDAANLASGVYLYRLTSGSFTAIRKMAVVK